MASLRASTRHLIDIRSLAEPDLRWLLDRTLALAEGAPVSPSGLVVANLFYEPSTRTRVSFELAASRAGAVCVNISAGESSVAKGESLTDTAATLGAMGIGVIVLRHPETGASGRLAQALPAGISLVNAGDGHGQHPTQALLDAAALEAAGVDWPRTRIAFLGDIRHSRVAHSGIELFHRLGAAEIRIAGPGGLLPDPDEELPVTRCGDRESAVEGADVIVCLRIQRERMDAAGWPEPEDYHRQWGLGLEQLALASGSVRVLHPGPMNRGVEIATAVADGPSSAILAQVRMGVHLRTAVFEWLAHGGAVEGD